METVIKTCTELTFLVSLNADRLAALAAVASGLVIGAWLGNLFINP
jgi:uncharacterized membrane protein